MFASAVKRNPDGAFIHFFDTDLSYREADRLSDALAAGLSCHGFGHGDRICVQAQSLPQTILAMLAAWKLGGVFVPLNPMYRPREIALLLADAQPKVLVAEPHLLSEVYDNIPEGGERPGLVLGADINIYGALDPRVGGPLPPASGAYEDISAFIERHADTPWSQPEIGPDDLASLIYTSGTTGLPKGAIITQRALSLGGELARVAQILPEQGTVLTLAPLFHVSGVVMSVAVAIHAAAGVILGYRFHPEVIVEAIAKHAPEVSAGSITAFIAIMNAPNATPDIISALKTPMSGGAPVPAAVAAEYERRFGVSLRTGYGLTETSGAVFMEPHSEDSRTDPETGSLSVGKVLPTFEADIVDDDGKVLPPRSVGEVVLRGPCVSPGYWRNRIETEGSMRPAGFYTGDVGFFDEDGWLYLIDRKKDVIIASGYKVWPREVEDVIYSHPSVREVAVVGANDSYRGETVKAVVSLKPGARASAEDIQTLCRDKLAAYKVPRIVAFMDELPKNAGGKILRRELRD
ncbi:long-chain-fatty-acid--CoA ligase [Brevundimonas abyssalis TAR-001]|uniref:3-methylmercaptopropionyl-CoA ligase n=2 Tax=Brevundimonas TaxID=41275 RepID=A0A8E0TRJ7_9CAUL|nr:long-chain-fatty-acid--CoA ligase [Brevundimonas abyssalis TAR-001]